MPEDHAPLNLPIIDLSAALDSDSQKKKRGAELLRAASEWGFLYLRSNLGVDAEAVDGMFDLSRAFFVETTPEEEKERFRIGPDDRGWSAPFVEVLDPENSKISEQDGGKDWFTSRHDTSIGSSGSILRLLHYPAATSNGNGNTSDDTQTGAIRAAAHTDFGSLTLLFQRPGQAGLEIQTPDLKWAPVPVYPPGLEDDPLPPIVVNIGDLLSYWTDGLLKSTMHRVKMPTLSENDRYSIAYFCHPLADTRLVPVPSKLLDDRRTAKENAAGAGFGRVNDRKRVMTAKEHLMSRLAATYGWTTSDEVA